MAGKKAEPKKPETPESEKYYLAGTVTTAMYGKRQFANGKKDKEDKYRISLKCSKKAIDGLKEIAEPFYLDVEDQWIPDWMKKDIPDDGDYINMQSGFDIRVGEYQNGETVDKGYMVDFLNENGGNINGSDVVVLVSIKPGAIYPAALLIKKLKKQDIGSMFKADDNGFMEAFGEELPFN